MVIAERRIGRPLAFQTRMAIAAMLARGSSKRDVARRLGLARRTVDKYARNLSASVGH